MKRFVLGVVVVAVLLGALLWVRGERASSRAHPPAVVDNQTAPDNLHRELPGRYTEAWIRSYDPEASSPGFNLVFFRRRLPMIIDMNGRVVHTWPDVRAVARLRLDHEGNLAVIGTGGLIEEYDWDGNPIWSYRLENANDFTHHDLIRTTGGNVLILARDDGARTDYLVEVDREKRVVWQWRFSDHREAFPEWDPRQEDSTHFNSIRELPENRWFAAGDERFRPGNILVSARNLNTVFIIDKATGAVVWRYSKELDYQHEAVMVERGQRGDGLVMLFNNGRDSRYVYRRSRVQLIDPMTDEVSWEYQSKYFYSTTGGTAQPLSNGNTLITSSHSGRAFEITPKGRIVWEWTPPYKAMRVERLAVDHCPQLADHVPQEIVRVDAPSGDPWIDSDLYGFAFSHEVVQQVVADKERELTPENDICRNLLIAPNSSMRVDYGIAKDGRHSGSLKGRFQLSVRGGGVREKLVDATVSSNDDSWISLRSLSLDRFADRRVTMCLSATVVGDGGDDAGELVWGNPMIQPRSRNRDETGAIEPVNDQERRLQEQQLKALGYVD